MGAHEDCHVCPPPERPHSAVCAHQPHIGCSQYSSGSASGTNLFLWPAAMLSLLPASSWRPTHRPAARGPRAARQQVRIPSRDACGLAGGSGWRRPSALPPARRHPRSDPTFSLVSLSRHGARRLPLREQLPALSSSSMSSSRRRQRCCRGALRWHPRWPPPPCPGSSPAPRWRCVAGCWGDGCFPLTSCAAARLPCSAARPPQPSGARRACLNPSTSLAALLHAGQRGGQGGAVAVREEEEAGAAGHVRRLGAACMPSCVGVGGQRPSTQQHPAAAATSEQLVEGWGPCANRSMSITPPRLPACLPASLPAGTCRRCWRRAGSSCAWAA